MFLKANNMMFVMTEDMFTAVSLMERIDDEDIDMTRLIASDVMERGIPDKNTDVIVMSSGKFNDFLDYWYYIAGSSFDYRLQVKAIPVANWTNAQLALSISLDEEWQRWKLIELCKRAGMTEEWKLAWRNGENGYEKVAYAAAEKLGVSIERKDYLL